MHINQLDTMLNGLRLETQQSQLNTWSCKLDVLKSQVHTLQEELGAQTDELTISVQVARNAVEHLNVT